jgi:hypothetical protein
VDQLPVWAFVVGAIAAFAMARAGRLLALLHQSHGGMELGGIATLAVFLAVVIFAVRRRQVSVWHSTVQVLGSLVVGNACALVIVWPFVPDGYGVALTPLLRDTVVAGAAMMLLSLPVGIGLLWLSRRYGSHSELTERRRMAQR